MVPFALLVLAALLVVIAEMIAYVKFAAYTGCLVEVDCIKGVFRVLIRVINIHILKLCCELLTCCDDGWLRDNIAKRGDPKSCC
jgi:hypothetical protein